jgi:GTP-binding protein
MVSNIGYNEYVGRLAIGRVRSGTIKVGDEVVCVQEKGQKKVSTTEMGDLVISKLK